MENHQNKKNTQIYFYDKSIYYFKISDVWSELHSLSSFHLYNIIHKKNLTFVKVDTVTNYNKI